MQFDVKGLEAGRRVLLKLEAADAIEAGDQARLQGLTVLDVRPGKGLAGLSLSRRKHFPLMMFSRELLALLNSGLSLVEALQTLEEKESHAETSRTFPGTRRSTSSCRPRASTCARTAMSCSWPRARNSRSRRSSSSRMPRRSPSSSRCSSSRAS